MNWLQIYTITLKYHKAARKNSPLTLKLILIHPFPVLSHPVEKTSNTASTCFRPAINRPPGG